MIVVDELFEQADGDKLGWYAPAAYLHHRPNVAATCGHDILNLTATNQVNSYSKRHSLNQTATSTSLI
ncbi:MAG TPA: hypothetical protein VNW90_12690 [Acetobacteraceae bacterium]|nr:hypothetical protein [Acetobacteraceae bacterium]